MNMSSPLCHRAKYDPYQWAATKLVILQLEKITFTNSCKGQSSYY